MILIWISCSRRRVIERKLPSTIIADPALIIRIYMKVFRKYPSNLWFVTDPVIFYRVVRGLVRALVFRKNTLKTIEIFPTMKCNLRCVMCSVDRYRKGADAALDISDYKRIASEGAKLGAISVNILGGEPLLYKNIEELISIFHNNHYFVLMVSNSTFVSEDLLRKLKKAGLGAICFSLDSLDEEENDRIRNHPGHFKKVMAAIEIAKEVGLYVSVAPVFFPNQIDKGEAVVRFAAEHGLGASGTQVAPVGAWSGDLLSPDENDRIRELVHKYPRFTLDWSMSYFLRQRCPAGKEKIGITCSGDIIGCSINQLAFGNAKQENLNVIIRRMQSFSWFKKNSPVCLASESREYIDTYLLPIHSAADQPVHFGSHPAISPENEPELFKD